MRKKSTIRTSRKALYKKWIFLLGVGIIALEIILWVLPSYGKKSFAQPTNAQDYGENAIVFCPDSHVIQHGSRDKKEVALTFDADMTYGMDQNLHSRVVRSYINQDLINILINTQTKATLFLSGLWIQDYPEETKLLGENPLFELGNHSFSHPSFEGYCYGLPQLGALSMEDEIVKTQELLKSVGNVSGKYFRFPGGCVSEKAMNFLSSKGIRVVHWDVVGEDGFNTNTQEIISNVLDNVQNGSIIVLHMNGYPNDPNTSDALPTIISTLRERGYKFVTVSQLLR